MGRVKRTRAAGIHAKEIAEIERILMETFRDCAEYAVVISRNFAVLVALDLIFASEVSTRWTVWNRN
jgi:dsDNA-specific endonuclease/ATPase MutS2